MPLAIWANQIPYFDHVSPSFTLNLPLSQQGAPNCIWGSGNELRSLQVADASAKRINELLGALFTASWLGYLTIFWKDSESTIASRGLNRYTTMVFKDSLSLLNIWNTKSRFRVLERPPIVSRACNFKRINKRLEQVFSWVAEILINAGTHCSVR